MELRQFAGPIEVAEPPERGKGAVVNRYRWQDGLVTFDTDTALRLVAQSLGLVEHLGADPIDVQNVRMGDRTTGANASRMYRDSTHQVPVCQVPVCQVPVPQEAV